MSRTSSQGSSALTTFPHSQKLLLARQLAGPGAALGEALSPPGSCSPHTRPKCVTEGERLVGWCVQPGTAMLDLSLGISEALPQPGRRAELGMSPDPTSAVIWQIKHQPHSKEWPLLVTTAAQTHFPAFCRDMDPAKPQEPPGTTQAQQSPAQHQHPQPGEGTALAPDVLPTSLPRLAAAKAPWGCWDTAADGYPR